MPGPSLTNPANATPTWAACSPASALTATSQATTTAAVRLAAFTLTTQVTLHAPSSNTAAIAIGPSGVSLAVGFILDPGESVTLPISNTNLLYLIGANTTDKLTWIGF